MYEPTTTTRALMVLGALTLSAHAGDGSEAEAIARLIDARVGAALRDAGLTPAPAATKEALRRRMTLDLHGVIPTARDAARAASAARVAGELLGSPRFDARLAELMTEGLLGRRRDADAEALRGWLRERFAANAPWDEIVRRLLTTRDRRSPEAGFLKRWGPKPTDLAAQSARVFLGLQIQCAECHDHPFSERSQEQFHRFAAWFTKAPYRPRLRKGAAPRLFTPGFPIALPDPPAKLEKRRQLASLMTHPGNPLFAKMTVNRVWRALFGRGLIEPLEDLEDGVEYIPGLLDELAAILVEGRFELRPLIAGLVASKAYQRSSRLRSEPGVSARKQVRGRPTPPASKPGAAKARAARERQFYARATLRRLTPNQIVDSLLRSSGRERPEPSSSEAQPSIEVIRYRYLRRELMRSFEALDPELSVDPDRFDGSIPQSLVLLNGRFVNMSIRADRGSLVASLVSKGKSPKKIVERLFLATLSRAPTREEKALLSGELRFAHTRTERAEDILWALVNCSEFLLNH